MNKRGMFVQCTQVTFNKQGNVISINAYLYKCHYGIFNKCLTHLLAKLVKSMP